MLDFNDWLKRKKFIVRRAWDIKNGKWVSNAPLQFFDLHKRIFHYALQREEDGTFKYTTIILSCPKKSGKTTWNAAIGAWAAEEFPEGTEIYTIANDREQAEGRVMKDIKFHAERRTPPPPRVVSYTIEYENDTFIQALAKSYSTAAGARHAVTLWDELWGYSSELSRRMWDEMTPIPTEPLSLRVITTYAGFENESDLLWELYLQGVGTDEHKDGQGTRVKGLEDLPCWENGKLFVYWDHEPRMPWQTEEYYQNEIISLRPAAYLRLHENQWVTSHEAFIPIEWWDYATEAFEKPVTLWPEHPYRNWPVFVGVDAATKKDCVALVGVTYDASEGKVILLFHKIWTPRSDEMFDLKATVENYLLEMYNKFSLSAVVYDPTQLHQAMTNLSQAGLYVEEFPQTVGNMTAASQTLYDLLKNRSIEAYPDEEFRSHIQMAVAEDKGRGFRIVKTKVSDRHKIDGAIALAMACHKALETGGSDVAEVVRIESPFSDVSHWKAEKEEELELPFPLRD